MSTTRRTFIRTLAVSGVVTIAGGSRLRAQTQQPAGCGLAATPGAMHHGAMGSATPMAGMHDVEFDQIYIDMMLPHHQSIIALAEVALPLLGDSRLKKMARDIIDTQSDEQTMMRDLREKWYGSPDPEPMTPEMMNMSMGHGAGMPMMGGGPASHMSGTPMGGTSMPMHQEACMDMDQMMNIMDPDWQVKTFLAADDRDLAFIEQTIPHHQMAIDASEVALTRAVHPETREIARNVIKAQQKEIDLLEEIRAELTGEATPAA